MKSMLFRACLPLAIFMSGTLASPPDNRNILKLDSNSAACQFTIATFNQSFPATGGSGIVTFNSSEPQCAWTARSNVPWITITSPTNGTGNGLAHFSVERTVSSRSGTLTIGGRAFTIWQSVNACSTANFALPKPILPTPGLLKFVAGDFNGDNRTDVVTFAQDGQYKLSFAAGRSDGGFNAPQPLSLGFTPQNTTSIKAADFNNDRKLDLLFTDGIPAKVYLLLGNGSGGFGAPAPFDVSSSSSSPIIPGSPKHTVVADLNNDRIPDVIICDDFTARVSVLIGTGAGGFNPALPFTPAETNTRALAMDTGDFNGDGKMDLIYLMYGSFQFLFLPSNGAGGFGRGTLTKFIDSGVSGAVTPNDLAVGDATGDGRADVIVASDKGLSVAPGDGAGGFGAATMLLRESCGPVFLGDFDGDGRADIATAAGLSLTLLRGLGGGRFAEPAQFIVGSNNLRALDYNRDGLTDLLLAAEVVVRPNPVAGFAVVHGNKNTGLTAPKGQPINLKVNKTAMEDLNGDGSPDLVMAYGLNSENSGFAVAFGDGAGGFGAPATYQQGFVNAFAVQDLNRDGKPDLAFANQISSGVSDVKVWINNGSGAFSMRQQISTGQTSVHLAFGDFNNDGKPDLILNNDLDPGLRLLAGAGDGTFSTLTARIPLSDVGHAFVTGDFDGDGNTDLAMWRQFNCSAENTKVFILSGNGRGSLAESAQITLPANPLSLAAADLNGDGRTDLVASNCQAVFENGVTVAIANPNGGFAIAEYPSGERGELLLGDINGDGRPDIVASSDFISHTGLVVLINKGDGGFNAPIHLNTKGSISIGDVNGDGTTDITVFLAAGEKGSIFPLPNVSRCLAADGVIATSAASYAGVKLAGGSIGALFGGALAAETRVAANLPLPTSLAGLSLTIQDSLNVVRLAPLFSVSPGQVNFQVPLDTTNGVARVNVIKDGNVAATSTIQVTPVTPGIFSADATGAGYPAAVVLRLKSNGSQIYEPVAFFDQSQNKFVARPIDLGPSTPSGDQVFLILFGTGIRNRSALSTVIARIGGEKAETLFAGRLDGFVGLDQINLRLPRSLAGRGEVDVVLTVDGKTANAVKVNIK